MADLHDECGISSGGHHMQSVVQSAPVSASSVPQWANGNGTDAIVLNQSDCNFFAAGNSALHCSLLLKSALMQTQHCRTQF